MIHPRQQKKKYNKNSYTNQNEEAVIGTKFRIQLVCNNNGKCRESVAASMPIASSLGERHHNRNKSTAAAAATPELYVYIMYSTCIDIYIYVCMCALRAFASQFTI